MSSFLLGLGLLETGGDADGTHAGHEPETSHVQTQETVPCRRPLFPRPGCRSSSQEDASPEDPANALASPENLLEAVKSPIPNERSSPEPNCSICLGKLQNKSFTNGCLHMFCYTCLLQWSKIKAECPLCKQSFKSIIHNVRSMQDYEEYELPTCPPLRVRELDSTGNYTTTHYRRGFPENVAFMHAMHDLQSESFGIPVPFRYRTTMTSRRQSFTEYISHSWVLPPAPASHQWRRRRHLATTEFRESIYVQDLWAQVPDGIGERYRDCSPAFYRANPAQVHRLVPWLNRELSVLFHTTTGSYPASIILDVILRYITRHEIRSPEFARLMRPHIGFRTEHFLHEFYSFACSHYDLIGYDQAVTYRPNPNPPRSIHISDDSDSDVEIIGITEMGSDSHNAEANYMSDSSMPLTRLVRPSREWRGTSSFREPRVTAPSREPVAPRPSSALAAQPSREPRPTGSLREPAPGPSREPAAGPSSAHDESDDCEVVCCIKPAHERTPEVIELSSEGEPEPGLSIGDLLQPPRASRSTDSDNHLSSSSFSNRTSGSEYLPERKRAVKKVVVKKARRSSYYRDEQQEPTDLSTRTPPRQRRSSSVADTKMPSEYYRNPDNMSQEARLEQCRHRAVHSYLQRNLLPVSESPRNFPHRRMNDLVAANTSTSSVEYLGSRTADELFSSPSSTSPVDDGETISTRAYHGSGTSETMPQHGSEDWGNSDSVSESDISLALLKARTSSSRDRPSTSRAPSSGKGIACRPVKIENVACPSASVSVAVGTEGPSSVSRGSGKKPSKRLRSAVLPGPSTSAAGRPDNAETHHYWQCKRRVPATDSDSSESEELKPRIKSIVITRNFKPIAQDLSTSRPSEEPRRKHKRKRSWLCKRRESSSTKGKRIFRRLSESSETSS